jgi:hypothetical protein
MKIQRRRVLLGALGAAACATSGEQPRPRRGLWRKPGGSVAVGKFPEFSSSDYLFDYEALRVGPIVNVNGAMMVGGRLDGAGEPRAALDARADEIAIEDRRYVNAPIRRRAFSARSEGVDIAAEMALPDCERRGVVLLVYGSGPAPKEAFDLWAFWFLSAGFAVITYDKRGSGASGGDWRLAGLETLASDARAVLVSARLLFAREFRTLFLWGASQAGWILPQLGADLGIDGLIVHAGSAMTPAEQILDSVEAELAAYGFPADEIERAKAYYALDTDVSRGKREYREIADAYDIAVAASAEWLLAPPHAADAPERTMIRLMADFDVSPYWRGNRTPTLALFGDKDLVVPAARNAVRLAELCEANKDFRALTLVGANHLMFAAETGVRAEYASRSSLHPGYFEAIEDWLGIHA